MLGAEVVVDGGLGSAVVGERQERVCTVPALVDTIVAEAPAAFVADIAFPVAGVGVGLAHVAEDSCFEAARRVFGCCCGARLGGYIGGPFVSVADENVRMFVVRRVAFWRRFLFVLYPRCVAEAEPVLAAFALPVALQTDVVVAIVASCAVVVEVVFDMCLAAAVADYLRALDIGLAAR